LAGEATQPWVGVALPSFTSTRAPLKLAGVAGAPNSAVPNSNVPLTVPLAARAIFGARAIGTWSVTLSPVQASAPPTTAAWRWALVMAVQARPELLSKTKFE